MLQCGGLYYSILQCVAVCCSVLQCVAVCCSLYCHGRDYGKYKFSKDCSLILLLFVVTIDLTLKKFHLGGKSAALACGLLPDGECVCVI